MKKNNYIKIRDIYNLLRSNLNPVKYRNVVERYRRNKGMCLVMFFSYYAINKKKFWNENQKIIKNYLLEIMEIEEFLYKKSDSKLKLIIKIAKEALLNNKN